MKITPHSIRLLDDLASVASAGRRTRERRGATGAGTFRASLRNWALALLALAGLVGWTLKPSHTGAALHARVERAARLMGRVLSDRDLVKLSVIDQTVEEKFADLSADERTRLTETIFVEAARYSLDPLLALAIIRQESNYQREAESFVGALGLMQVRPFVGREVASWVGITWRGRPTLVNPVENVRIGMAYLAKMKQLYQQNELALLAYNLGPYRLKAILAQGEAPSSQYASRVLSFYRSFQNNYLTALAEAGTAAPDTQTLALADDSALESDSI